MTFEARDSATKIVPTATNTQKEQVFNIVMFCNLNKRKAHYILLGTIILNLINDKTRIKFLQAKKYLLIHYLNAICVI